MRHFGAARYYRLSVPRLHVVSAVANSTVPGVEAVTFTELVCGNDVAKRVRHSRAPQQMLRNFTSRTNGAVIPVPLAAHSFVRCVYERQFDDAQSLLLSHPQATSVVEAARPLLKCGQEGTLEGVSPLVEFLRMAHHVPTSVLAPIFIEASKAIATSSDDAAGRATLWDAMQLRIGQDSQSAGFLISSLCQIAESGDVVSVVDALQACTRDGGYVKTSDFAAVISLLVTQGDCARALRMWTWVSLTAACWDVEAVSAVVIAASKTNRLNVAADAIQVLATVGRDPSLESRKIFVRYLGLRRPAMPGYAQQLVDYWYPGKSLWTGDGKIIGVELGFVYLHCRMTDRLAALLECAANATSSAEKHSLLRQNGFSVLLKHIVSQPASVSRNSNSAGATDGMHSSDERSVPPQENAMPDADAINSSSTAIDSLMDAARSLDDLTHHPHILAMLMLSGTPATRQTVLDRISKTTDASPLMSLENFTQTVRTMAEDHVAWGDPSDTLRIIRELSECVGHEVPSDVETWLQIVSDAQKV